MDRQHGGVWAGEICCYCRRSLDPPRPGRERSCDACVRTQAYRKIRMRFENCMGWRVSFSDPQNVRTAFLELTFADSQKLEELVKRTETCMVLADQQAFETGIRNGRGMVELTLTPAQYRKLMR